MVRLLRDGRLTLDQLDDELDHASGLVGVTGTTDVAALEAAAAAGDPTATLGLAMFAERAAAGIAAAATALSALDAIVFTGGIGEHAAPTRSQIVARLAVLGVEALPPGPVDDDAILGDLRAPVAVLRIAAREDLVIARHAQRLIDSRGQPA
jgi:acetate kinase